MTIKSAKTIFVYHTIKEQLCMSSDNVSKNIKWL